MVLGGEGRRRGGLLSYLTCCLSLLKTARQNGYWEREGGGIYCRVKFLHLVVYMLILA